MRFSVIYNQRHVAVALSFQRPTRAYLGWYQLFLFTFLPPGTQPVRLTAFDVLEGWSIRVFCQKTLILYYSAVLDEGLCGPSLCKQTN